MNDTITCAMCKKPANTIDEYGLPICYDDLSQWEWAKSLPKSNKPSLWARLTRRNRK